MIQYRLPNMTQIGNQHLKNSFHYLDSTRGLSRSFVVYLTVMLEFFGCQYD